MPPQEVFVASTGVIGEPLDPAMFAAVLRLRRRDRGRRLA